jgi:hypothetical protein
MPKAHRLSASSLRGAPDPMQGSPPGGGVEYQHFAPLGGAPVENPKRLPSPRSTPPTGFKNAQHNEEALRRACLKSCCS